MCGGGWWPSGVPSRHAGGSIPPVWHRWHGGDLDVARTTLTSMLRRAKTSLGKKGNLAAKATKDDYCDKGDFRGLAAYICL